MKKIFWLFILLLPIRLFGQTLEDKFMVEKWKEVESLLAMKNYEQSLPYLAVIKSHAKKEGNSAEWIRAILAENQVKTINQNGEQAFISIRTHFEKSIAESKTIEKAILNNFYAMFLWTNANNYKTKSTDNYLTAAGTKKMQIIDSLFKESIKNEQLLINTKSDNYTTLFVVVKNLSLTPTVYHFLSYQYLDFLKQIQQSKEHDNLYQNILAINKKYGFDNAISYLLTKDIAMNHYATEEWVPKIENIIAEYPSDYNAYLLYTIANSYFERNKASTNKYIQKAITNYPTSPWIANVISLEKRLKQADIKIEHSLFEPAQTYIPIKLKTRNTDKIYIRVYNTTNSPKSYTNKLVKHDTLTFRTTLDAPLAYEESKDLKSFKNFENHSTIYKINPLTPGNYTIIVSNNIDYINDGEQRTTVTSQVIVSDIFLTASLDKVNRSNDDYKLLLINRKTGKPFANKSLSLYRITDQTPYLVMSGKSDKNGEFFYESDAQKHRNLNDLEIYIPEENQLIKLGNLKDVARHAVLQNRPNDGYLQFRTMMDRAIYRPGQELHFKSILYNNHKTKGHVIANEEIRVNLFDANRKIIDSISLITNEFGSIHGTFKIPSQTLAGSFRLELKTKTKETGSHYFRIEEYKRPTFKVEFEPNKETYTHQDTAIFVGKAESLAGARLSDASVRYKVNFYNSKDYKTVNYVDSLIQTDEEGKFYIKIPLSDSIFNTLKYFRLNYSAEVTNQSGEMQKASDGYNFTTKPWNISIQTARKIEEGRWSMLEVLTKNQHGHPLKFAGKLNIYKLKEIEKPISIKYLNYFQTVNYHTLSPEEYEKYFPNYFDKQMLEENTKTKVATYTFDTNNTSLINLDSSQFSKGNYEIEAISIQGVDTIRHSTTVNVYEAKSNKTANNSFIAYKLNKNIYELGEKVEITFSTDVRSPQSLFLFEANGYNKKPTKVLRWKNGEIIYSFLLNDNKEGKLYLNALFVVNNQAQPLTIEIPIIEKNKSIEIKTHTFRDKISPGQKEKWSFTLQAKEDKLTAELIATMYDSSLDQFASNSFSSVFSLNEDYKRLNFYYLSNEFHQRKSSYKIFNKSLTSPLIDNLLSIPRTYNLWIPQQNYNLRRNFGDDNQMIQEVIVVGYGQQQKLTVTGSAAGFTRGVEGGTGVGEEIFLSVDDEFRIRGNSSASTSEPLYVLDGEIINKSTFDALSKIEIDNINVLKDVAATALYGSRGANGVIVITTKEGKLKEERLINVQARTNLQETAFFYPTLYSDANGNVSFEFDSPEALTKWKLLLFAHSKTLQSGSATFFTQTQKQLMVRPNLPRYFREGDKIALKTQIQNLSREIQKGDARLEIINPETNENITSKFITENHIKTFEAAAAKNTIVEWELLVPKDYSSIQIKIVAATNKFSDGEIQEIAVLPNRVLVTDTEKIILKPTQAEEYRIHSAGKDNLQARIQVQSNPILEIISALDYLKNYPYECNEQIVSKWFGLKMVEYIGKKYPDISFYFQSLKTDEATGKLEENTTLSQLKLEEMPWLRDVAKDEEKLKSIAKLFNSGIQQELKTLEQKISKNQMPSGGYSWFDGGKENTYISTRILEVMGKALLLDHTLVNANMKAVAQKLVTYLDNDTTIFNQKNSYHTALDYLYARHYWNGYYPLDKQKVEKLQAIIQNSSLTTASQPAGLAAKAWVASQLFGTSKTSNELKNRITQEAIWDEERGIYWESNNSYYNRSSLQTYMVEAYKLHNPAKLHDITQWLFYSKQANHWQTTWMTVDAVYALLLANNPKDFAIENTVKIWIDDNESEQNKTVLGQFTKSLSKAELTADKQVKIQNNNTRTIFGNIVHQFFSPLEVIQKTLKDISVNKQYFVERNGKWVETSEAKLGERIKVKITVVNDNPLQYVHIKDARPSGVEPIYQPSGYKWWQGYYFTSKDASTNYFYGHLKKGLTELEYEVKANNIGVFNSGITTVECMYEPAVNARSENKVLTIVP